MAKVSKVCGGRSGFIVAAAAFADADTTKVVAAAAGPDVVAIQPSFYVLAIRKAFDGGGKKVAALHRTHAATGGPSSVTHHWGAF